MKPSLRPRSLSSPLLLAALGLGLILSACTPAPAAPPTSAAAAKPAPAAPAAPAAPSAPAAPAAKAEAPIVPNPPAAAPAPAASPQAGSEASTARSKAAARNTERVHYVDDQMTGQPKAGGNLRVLLRIDTQTLDPHKTTEATAFIFDEQMYESLVDSQLGEIVPSLAESWTISPDG